MIVRIEDRQEFLDAKLALCNGGTLKIYAGTRPAAFALSGNPLLGTCPLSATAAGATNSSGVATLNAITTDSAPAATGTATFAFLCTSGGTPILNLSVGAVASGADIEVTSTSVVATTGSIAISSATVTFPAGD